MKILVVDHEKVNRANLADKLIAHGHQATSVGDGQEASTDSTTNLSI